MIEVVPTHVLFVTFQQSLILKTDKTNSVFIEYNLYHDIKSFYSTKQRNISEGDQSKCRRQILETEKIRLCSTPVSQNYIDRYKPMI